MLIDTHCHLTDARLSSDVEDIVFRANERDLLAMITVGYDRPSSLKGAKIASKYENVYCALGVHPHDADTAVEDVYSEFRDIAFSNEKVVAIGEIGLDYYRDLSPRDIQKKAFREQIEIANELRLPVCLHVRDAYEDCRAVLEETKHLLSYGVLLHCYSGSSEMVKVFSRYDAYFAFGGAITFSNARKNIESLMAVPRDRLLLETDAPYLTPVPFRGKTNRPELIRYVADKVAEVLSISREEADEITVRNTKELFRRIK